jgi:hypothetical protein
MPPTNEQRPSPKGSSGAAQERAEKALKERAQLNAAYRRAKSAHRRELYEHEPRLRQFGLTLNRYQMPDAAAFLTYVREENRSWLLTAPPELRAEALSLVNERIQRIRQGRGLVPLDDPLPDEDDDVWQLCKQELT